MQNDVQSILSRRAWLRRLASAALAGGTSCGLALSLSADDGPNSSLYSGRMPLAPVAVSRQAGLAPLPQPATSWYEVPLPPPKEVRVHDIITIRVDKASRMISDAEWQRRKNSKYDAILNDWIVLKGLRAVKPAPQSDGDQRIQGNLNIQDRSQGELETTQSLKFEIGASVAAVLPNGNIVLEAHDTFQINDEKWLHSLSGVCSREAIGPGNIVLSKDLANLQIEKRELGQVKDAYRRGWLTRWWDDFGPF